MGTIKPSEIEVQEAHDRFNADATGEGMAEAVLPIDIKLAKPMRKHIIQKIRPTIGSAGKRIVISQQTYYVALAVGDWLLVFWIAVLVPNCIV